MAKRRALFLLWCAMVGVLYLFENNTATRILLVCPWALALLDGLLAVMAARTLRCSVQAPESARKGEAIVITLCAECPVPMVQLRARVQSENRLTGEHAQAEMGLRRTGPCRAEQRCLLRAQHCGVVSVQVQADVCGLLGLYARRAVAHACAGIWVPPELKPVQVALTEDGSGRDDATADGRCLSGAWGDSFAVRAYATGDPVRLIHWKLSEKLDTVMVREPEAPLPERLLLAVDLSCGASATELDAMTERLFSLSRALLSGGTPHGVLWLPEQAVQPELRRVETEADEAALEADYFAVTPSRSMPLVPDEAAAGYAHVVVLGSPSLARAFAALGGRRVTLMADCREPVEECRVVPLTGDAEVTL